VGSRKALDVPTPEASFTFQGGEEHSGFNMKRIPVLLMVRELGIGGTERQLVETARFLQGDHFEPHVGCFRPGGLWTKDLEAAGVPILHLPVYSFKSPAVVSGARQLARYIHDHHIQIVHSFDAPLNVFAVPVARWAGTPAVLSSQRGDRDLTTQRLKRLLRITDRIVDAVVVNCEAMRRYMVEEERVPADKVRLCYNGIDVDAYRRQPALAEANNNGRPVIGCVCALRPEKGLDTLLRAFANVRELATLLIVGSGPEEAKLRALASELGVSERCHFEPATSQVAQWLSRMDIFVLPSRTEALSNALMEAMACSCSPIATAVGGNPELIDHESNGLLFPVDDVARLSAQLRELLANSALRERLASAATETIRSKFTFPQAAAAMREIYESVLNAKLAKRRPANTSA
jgi:glycosyltransferase involved in cell wall biosynthesis